MSSVTSTLVVLALAGVAPVALYDPLVRLRSVSTGRASRAQAKRVCLLIAAVTVVALWSLQRDQVLSATLLAVLLLAGGPAGLAVVRTSTARRARRATTAQ